MPLFCGSVGGGPKENIQSGWSYEDFGKQRGVFKTKTTMYKYRNILNNEPVVTFLLCNFYIEKLRLT